MKTNDVKNQLKWFGQMSLIALALCGGKITFAGERGGNGGDVLVCPSYSILLDAYEASLRNFTLDLPGNTLREKVESSLARLVPLDPGRAIELKFYANEILVDLESKEADASYRMKHVTMTKDTLTDIDDSVELSIPTGCSKKQLVIQKEVIFPQDTRYIINSDLWASLDEENKALTVLHEAWYRDTLNFGAKDSRMARYMNGLLAANPETLNAWSYAKTLLLSEKLGFMMNPYIQSSLSVQSNLIKLRYAVASNELLFFPLKNDKNLGVGVENVSGGFSLSEFRVSKEGKRTIIARMSHGNFNNGSIKIKKREVYAELNENYQVVKVYGSGIKSATIDGVRYKYPSVIYVDEKGNMKVLDQGCADNYKIKAIVMRPQSLGGGIAETTGVFLGAGGAMAATIAVGLGPIGLFPTMGVYLAYVNKNERVRYFAELIEAARQYDLDSKSIRIPDRDSWYGSTIGNYKSTFERIESRVKKNFPEATSTDILMAIAQADKVESFCKNSLKTSVRSFSKVIIDQL